MSNEVIFSTILKIIYLKMISISKIFLKIQNYYSILINITKYQKSDTICQMFQ